MRAGARLGGIKFLRGEAARRIMEAFMVIEDGEVVVGKSREQREEGKAA